MEKILKILTDIHPEYESEYASSDDFIDDGLLDSFDIIALVSDLEDAFDVKIKGVDILPENFSTIETIKEIIVKSGGKA